MNEKLNQALKNARLAVRQVGEAASDVAWIVEKKADAAAETARKNAHAEAVRQEIDTRLMELGALLYATHIGNPTDSETLLQKMEQIDALYNELKK